jgi:hypothetical protein
LLALNLHWQKRQAGGAQVANAKGKTLFGVISEGVHAA